MPSEAFTAALRGDTASRRGDENAQRAAPFPSPRKPLVPQERQAPSQISTDAGGESLASSQARSTAPSAAFQAVVRPEPIARTEPPVPELKPEVRTSAESEAGTLTPLQQSLGVSPAASERQRRFREKKSELLAQELAKVQNEPQYGAFVRGVQSGVMGVREILSGLKALGATVVGDEEALNDAADFMARAEARQEVLGTRVQKVEDFFTRSDLTLGDFLEWAAFNLGEQIPNIASVVATGGLGGLVTRQVGKLAARKAITDLEARALVRTFTERGAKAGAFLGATGLETGSTATEQLTATGEINPLITIGAGTLKGALEVLTPAAIATRFGMSETLGARFYSQLMDKLTKGGLVRRTVGGALTVAAGEAVTEGLQETVDNFARGFVDENYDSLGPDAISRILNAAAVGGLVGGLPGAVTGAATRGGIEQKAATRSEIEALLKTPTPEFRAPGGFVVSGTLEQGKSAVFQPAFEAETTPRGPDAKLQQIDISQVPIETLSARLEDLPGKGVIHEGGTTDLTIHDAVRRAIDLRDRAQRLALAVGSPTIATATLEQVQAKKLMEEAQTLYEQAVQGGFRYIPKGGLEQLQKEGAVIADAGVIPQSALREVETTGAEFLPENVLSVIPSEVPGWEGAFGVYTGLSSAENVRAFVLKSEVGEENLTATTVELPYNGAELQQRIHFASGLSEEQKASLTERALDALINNPVKNRARAYSELVKEGLRFKPMEGKALLVGIPRSRLHPVPAHVGPGTTHLTRGLQHREEWGMRLNVDQFNNRFHGTGYDVREHKVGQLVSLKGLVSGERARLQKLAEDTLQTLLNRMGRDIKLVLDTRVGAVGSEMGSHAHSAGWDEDGNGVGSIYLDSRAFDDEAKLAHVLFHEFGHILSSFKLGKATAKERSAIFTAFLRRLSTQQRQNSGEFWLQFADPVRLAHYGQDKTIFGPNAAVAIASNSSFQQWYKFEEFIAESVSKWMTQEGTSARTLAERFFKNLGSLLRQALEILQKKFGRVTEPVDAAVRDWLERIYEHQETGHEPLTKPMLVQPLDDGHGSHSSDASYGVTLRNLDVPREQRDATDKYAWYVRWGWNILQLASANPHIEGLQRYVERVRLWHQEKMQWISRADERAVAWRNLGKEMGQRLGDFIWELETMPWLREGEKPRQPTDAELIALAEKHKLSHDALQLWKEIKTDFDAVLVKIEQVWTRDAVNTINDPNELGKAVLQIKKEMAALRSRPYFPHARFGDWTVSVRDEDGKLLKFFQFENRKAQEAGFASMQEEYPTAHVQMGKMPEDMGIFRGLPAGLIDSIAAKLELSATQLEALEQIKFSMSPANSWAKHLKKRKGTPGWSTDALRGYSNYFFHAAHHLARIEHRPRLEEAVRLVQESGRVLVDKRKRDEITDYLNRHLQYILYPPNEASGIRSIGFTWLLGFAPDSALVNLTQVPLVAAPYLSSRFGDVKTLAALTSASKDLWKLYHAEQYVGKMDQDIIDAQALGIELGIIDQSFAAELAATAHGGTMQRFVGGTAAERTLAGLGRAAAFMFRTTEKLNRVTVFNAAYKLGRANPTSAHIRELLAANSEFVTDLELKGWMPEHIAGFLAARDAVERTMFEYSQWARPEFMRGKKGALFTFFMFQQNMAWFARYSPGNKRYLALLLAASGVMGFPLAEDLDDVLKALLTKVMGRYFDPETELRQLVAEMGIDPTLVAHGFGSDSFGLRTLGEMVGIPIPGIDISRRLGMGKMVPGVEPLSSLALGADWTDVVAQTTEEVIGASYAIPFNLVQAVAGFELGNFKSYERLMPRAFKNLTRAVRWGMSGEETNGSGAVLRRFDPQDPQSLAEMGGAALGFVPAPLMQRWDRARIEAEVGRYWTTQRSILFDQFWRAARVRDREAMADARAAIKKFNKSVPYAGLRITADNLRSSVRSRQRDVAKQEAGVPSSRTLAGPTRALEEAYPVQSQR